MGVLDTIRAAIGGTAGGGLVSFVDQRGLFEDYVLGLSPEDMYRTQPHLRTVISFLARNVAQLGVHCFERVSDTDRKRIKDDPLAQLLAAPNADMTTYDLIERLVADLGLYDEALWVYEEDLSRPSGWNLQPIPPSWILRFGGGSVFAVDWVEIKPPGAAKPTRIPRKNFIHFHGWDPSSLTKGTTPVAALKATLQEQIHAVKYRDQLWTRAGRVGITVTRPTQDKGGAKWTPEQKRRFKHVLDSKLAGDGGSDAGGSIILEDGMTMDRMRFTAHEEEFVEGAKLALSTVAQVYHVNPTMIGLLDNANFSNVREFNRSLYTNTLGPILAKLQATINTHLVPRVATAQSLYVEFNIGEKLQGSFEEQAAVVSTATGRPWQTVNESRARFNLPAIEDGDSLSIPLNVVLGGGSQASLHDTSPGGGSSLEDLGELTAEAGKLTPSGYTPDELVKLINAAALLIRSGFSPESALTAVGLDPIEHLGLLPVTVQKPVTEGGEVDEEIQDALKAAVLVRRKAQRRAQAALPKARRAFDSKARAHANYEANVARVLKGFYARQRKAVLAALGAKAPEWWDEARWNRELGEDLLKLALLTASTIGRQTAEAMGFDPEEYDETRTLKFLKAVSDSRAAAINGATLSAIEEALDSGEDEDGNPVRTPADVFDDAEETRSKSGAATLVTTFAAFATVEAATQLAAGKAQKTWLVNSGNPRSEHAAMDGETVGIEDAFSNGANWPGDPVLGADGVSNCQCSVEVSLS